MADLACGARTGRGQLTGHVSPARIRAGVLLLATAACGQPPLRLTPAAPAVGDGEIEHSVFFIGDAGVPEAPTDPVLVALRATAEGEAFRNTVVFLGDNIYPRGMPDVGTAGREQAERRLQSQIDAVPPGARGIFLMGNHDWVRGRDGGWDAVRRQEQYVVAAGRDSVRVLPGGGCPGPTALDVSSRLRLVVIDTQWWLQGDDRPEHPTSACPTDSMSEIMDALRRVLQPDTARVVLVAGHHPLRSGGVHGGKFEWTDHVFPLRAWKKWLWVPLPIIGSLYPLVRGSGVSKQDMGSGAYGEMRDSLVAAFDGHPLAYAAGHEHNLQVLDGSGARYLLVTGAGNFDHRSAAFRLPETRYAREAPGFIRVDVLHGGRVRLAVLVVDERGIAAEDFSMWLEGS